VNGLLLEKFVCKQQIKASQLIVCLESFKCEGKALESGLITCFFVCLRVYGLRCLRACGGV